MTIKILLCLDCKHFIGKIKSISIPVCEAFGNGIPAELLNNSIKHTKPYPGDNGIQFEPIEDKKKDEA